MIQNNIILTDPTPITATLQINQENCTNLEGILEVINTAGGQGSNYTYQLIKDGADFGASQNTTVFTGLGEGVYNVRITDQWSCTVTVGPQELFDEINPITTVVKPIDCTATPDGTISVNVTGGSGNLEYEVTFPDGVTIVTNTTGSFTGLSQVGVYSFEVRDLETSNPVCSKTLTEELVAPSVTTLGTHTITDVSCNGLSDGIIVVGLADRAPGINEDPAYMYVLWDNGVIIEGPQSSPTFDGLAAGSYEVQAISSKGCESIREVVIVDEPTPLVITASATEFACLANNTTNTATLTVLISDGATTPGVPSGTSPYLYSIDNVNFQPGNTFTIVDTGVQQTIDVYVRDANGCPQTTQVVIEPINTFTATVTRDAAITCVGPEEVTITVTDNGVATNGYTFELLPVGNPNGISTGTPTNTTATFNLSAVGNYTFRVTDTATGCYVDTATYEIMPFDLIEATAVAVDPVQCFGDLNGSLEINVTGYTGNYTYVIFDSNNISTRITGAGNTATPELVPGLSGGSYYVTVTEADAGSTMCSANTNTITIVSPDRALTTTVDEAANVTCTNDQGEILVDPDGGYPPYDIVLTNTTTAQVYTQDNVQSFVFSGLAEGDYTVVITDDNGCIINDTQRLTRPTFITADITASPTALECFGDTNAVVSAITVAGGQGTYLYQLNYYDAAGTTILFTTGGQSNPNFGDLSAGIYSITVTDGWNCDVETVQITITEPTEVASTLIQRTI